MQELPAMEEQKIRVFVTLRPDEDALRKKHPMKLLWLERRGVSGYDINSLTWRIRSLGGPFAEFKEMDLYLNNEKLTADRVRLNEDCVLQVAQKVADMTDVIDIPDSRIATTEFSSSWQWNKIPARWNALLWRICLLLAIEESQKVDDRIGRGPHVVFLQVLRESSMLVSMIPSESEREEFLRQLMEEIRFPNSKVSCVHVLAALRAVEKKREIKVAPGFFNQLNPPAFARTAVITTSDEKMKFRINVTDNLDPAQTAARIVEQFNLDHEEVEFLTGALQHEQCACLQQELPRQKEAWRVFQQQISAVERLMLEFDRVATTALSNAQKPKVVDVRAKQSAHYGVLVKKFARQIVEAQEELARLRDPSSPREAANKGVLLGSGGAQDESDNEFNAADRDRDGVITRQEFDSWVAEKRSLIAAAEADHRQLTNENMRLRGQIAEMEAGHKIYKQLQAWEREKQQLLSDIERLRESERLVHDLRTAIFEQLRVVQEAADSPEKEFELKEGWLRLSREEIQERKRQEFAVLDKVSQEEEERWRAELNQLQQRLAKLENEVRAKDAHANDLEVTSRSFGQFD